MRRAKPKNLKGTLARLGPYFAERLPSFILVIVTAIISALASVIGTYMLKPIINEYILPGDIPGLIRSLLIMAVIYAAGVLGTLGYSRIMIYSAQHIIYSLRHDLFQRVQSLPVGYFDTHTHGELMSRFTNDIDTIAEALNNSVTVVVQSFITLLATFMLLFALDVKLSLIVLASFALTALFLRYSTKRSRHYFSKQQEQLASVNGFAEEMVSGQKVVQVFNHERENLESFRLRNEKLREVGTSAAGYSALIIPTVVSISYLNYTIVACLGAFFAIAANLDLGSLASYLVFVRQTAMPMNQFTQQLNIIMAALAGAEHIFEVMDELPESDKGKITRVKARYGKDGVIEETDMSNLWVWKKTDGEKVYYTPVKGDMEFRNLSFGYTPEHLILKDINLYAKPGQKIAFVGSTGAGKTTITNLINRFYDISSGSITYDGIDIRDIKKDALRQSMSMVLQDTHLFTGTIKDNIRYGSLEADDELAIEAAKISNADSFIRRLPQGYDTMIYGDGENLSAGQRQLLAIARAAIADPPVLILDEATSNIDTYTEKLVNEGMDHLMMGRTVFVIAHRLSTVRNADAIMVLEKGEIIERGSHDELVAMKGRYYKLYTGQFELS